MQDIQPQMDLSVLEKMKSDEPIATYAKTIVGRLGITVFNPITSRPEDRILSGDPSDPKADKDQMIVKIYDESSHLYFKNVNKKLIEAGKLVPFVGELPGVNMVNAITADEIDEILSKPHLALANKIAKFTTTDPMERILMRAIELNKPNGTIEFIKGKIGEMQLSEKENKASLEDYYRNLQR